MIDMSIFVPSGNYLMVVVSDIRLTFLFLSYWKKIIFPKLTFKLLSNVLGDLRFFCETNFLMLYFWYDFIKSGTKFFNICALVVLPPSQSRVRFGASMLCMIMLPFFKSPFGGYDIFYIDRKNPGIFLILCRKLVTYQKVGNGVNNIRELKVIIVH